MARRLLLILLILLVPCGPHLRAAQANGNACIPGELIADPPTFRCLGFRWLISGDDNANATVTISYRKSGETTWRDALPMLRVHGEVTDRDGTPYTAGNLFAGSILNLDQGVEYEVRFHLRDPDGGNDERTLTARTRSGLRTPEGRWIYVLPDEDARLKTGKDFHTLVEALRMARPGDKVSLGQGLYHGPIVIPTNGDPGKPICIWAAPWATIEGPGNAGNVIDASGKDHLWFSNLTIRRGRTGIKANGCKNLTVRNCKLEDVNNGIVTYSPDASGWLIEGNEFSGRVKNWYPRVDSSDTGINCPGSGMAICHNRILHFWDGISTDNIGRPKPEWPNALHPPQTAIDIYGNDISEILDDGIEADYALYNIRVFENRVTNVHTGISAQPNLGGPLYVFRNVVYNTTNTPLKMHNYSTGVLVYHNTFIGAGQGFSSYPPVWQNSTFRNNLFLGARGYAMETGSPDRRSSLDYDGFARSPVWELLVKWSSDGGKNWVRYRTLKDFTGGSGQEAHGIELGYDAFERAAAPKEGRTHAIGDLDLRIMAGAAAVDAGCRLPTINDGFRGKAPDLGAIEQGNSWPQFGPARSIDKDH